LDILLTGTAGQIVLKNKEVGTDAPDPDRSFGNPTAG
jgi:hypothetical protein